MCIGSFEVQQLRCHVGLESTVQWRRPDMKPTAGSSAPPSLEARLPVCTLPLSPHSPVSAVYLSVLTVTSSPPPHHHHPACSPSLSYYHHWHYLFFSHHFSVLFMPRQEQKLPEPSCTLATPLVSKRSSQLRSSLTVLNPSFRDSNAATD